MTEKTAILIDSVGVPIGTLENPLVIVASGGSAEDSTKIAIPLGGNNERKVFFSLDINGTQSFTSGVGLDLSGRFDFDGKIVVNAIIDGGDF